MSADAIASETLSLLKEVDSTSRGHLASPEWPASQLYPCFNIFIGLEAKSYETPLRQLVTGFVERHGTGRDVTVVSTLINHPDESKTAWITLYGERRDGDGESPKSAMTLLPSGDWTESSLRKLTQWPFNKQLADHGLTNLERHLDPRWATLMENGGKCRAQSSNPSFNKVARSHRSNDRL
jgi:hypothetical protein